MLSYLWIFVLKPQAILCGTWGRQSVAGTGLSSAALVFASFISIQPYRPGWQEPEPSHVTGMALAHCILGKYLGVVCHSGI